MSGIRPPSRFDTLLHPILARWAQGALLGLLCALLVLGVRATRRLDGLEHATLDTLFQARGARYPSPRIIILVADDAVVARWGGWPLPRRVYADVVRRLQRAGAHTIAFDVLFPTDAPGEAKDDRDFALACRDAHRVVQAFAFNPEHADTANAHTPGKVRPLPPHFTITNQGAPCRDAISGSPPRPALLESAAGLGHVTVVNEWDGALRRIPNVMRYRGNAVYPSLALATAAHYLGVAPHDIVAVPKSQAGIEASAVMGDQGEAETGEVLLAGRHIPLDANGETLVNWVGSNETIPTFTFNQLFDGIVPDSILKDRIVLVGITATGAYEHHATPFSPNQPAVELQANAMDDILSDRLLRETAPWLQVVLLLCFAALVGVLLEGRNARGGTLMFCVLGLGLWAGAVLLLSYENFYVPVAAPLVAGLLTSGASIGRRQIKATRQLKVAEERYALAVRGANDGVWDWNLETGEIYFSPRWKRMLGFKDDEIGSDPEEWFRRVHLEDIEHVRAALKAHLEGTGTHFECEYRMRHKDGEWRWMLSRGMLSRTGPVHPKTVKQAGKKANRPAWGKKVTTGQPEKARNDATQDAIEKLALLDGGKPRRMAGSQTDITARKEAEARLLHNAYHDALTHLPNRHMFMNRLEQTVGRARRRDDYIFAVLFLDLDRFKNINDSLGHAAGDELLVEIAERLSDNLRAGDMAARLGGDEFTILLDDLEDVQDATRVAGRFQEILQQPFDLNGHEITPTVSIGIALSTTHYEQPEDVLRDADTAMYRAKALGAGRQEVFDTAMHARAVALLRLETDLRRALEKENFHVHYQAIVSLHDGHIAGFEALARWQHPGRGLVSPGEFVPVAEDTGLIVAIDQWVLREACRQTRIWQTRLATPQVASCPKTVQAGAKTTAPIILQETAHGTVDHDIAAHNGVVSARRPLSISVNLSGRQFSQSDLVAQIERTIRDLEFDPSCLKLELTEGVIMDNAEATTAMLTQLKALGIELSIDDFGTGYSSLAYLHRFPIDYLKIDRSFVSRIGPSCENCEIVRAIITLARNLDMKVIAEGIETAEQLEQLRELGCDYGQGYYFSKPVNADEATLLLMRDPCW